MNGRLAYLLIVGVVLSMFAEGATTCDSPMFSLTEKVPVLFAFSRRYPKWFGSGTTADCPLLCRPELTGNWGGARTHLIHHGIYFDLSVTQIAQSNVYGGKTTGGGWPYGGSADYWLSIDTGELGIWPGGLWVLHGETGFGESVNKDSGALIPVNFDAVMPKANEPGLTTLSELYLIQALGKQFIFVCGKLNVSGWADQNVFANNERTQFLNTSLVNNPVIFPLAPYTPLTVAGVWLPDKHNSLSIIALDTNGTVTRTGFDTAFSSPDGTTVATQYGIAHEAFRGLPGNIRILGGFTTKRFLTFAIDPRYFLASVIGIAPPIDVKGNWAFAANFDQYLCIKDRKKGVGWGIFGRIGFSPTDRNAIDQFYSFGIGGKGCVWPGRQEDLWGIGWGGSHLSKDLRKQLAALITSIRDYEHAIEAFYNFQITPAIHLALDSQFIFNPVAAQVSNETQSVAKDTSGIVLGMRLQMDF